MSLKKLYGLFLWMISIHVTAQELNAELSYKYMYAPQWDKIIQTYNFSRPALTQKQALFTNGYNASLSYVFKNERGLKHGISLSYSYFRSAAENENLNNTLYLHFINVGYMLHYENPEKWKQFYTDLIVSATGSALFRNVNGEVYVHDEKIAKAFGIGGDVQLKLGYRLNWKSGYGISPFVSLDYTPYFFSPNTEAVINQTKGLAAKSWTGILTAQIGLAFYLKKHGTE